jgi:hypothetical protein
MPTDISPFAVQHTEIEGLKILRMKQVTDERGTIREFYREPRVARQAAAALPSGPVATCAWFALVHWRNGSASGRRLCTPSASGCLITSGPVNLAEHRIHRKQILGGPTHEYYIGA